MITSEERIEDSAATSKLRLMVKWTVIVVLSFVSVFSVSVVSVIGGIHHRDTENTEDSQTTSSNHNTTCQSL